MITQFPSEDCKSPPVFNVGKEESNPVRTREMTEEDLYHLHFQTYIKDTMGELIGGLEYCEDLDFLFDDSDEVDPDDQPRVLDNYHQKDGSSEGKYGPPIFEFCIAHFKEEESNFLDFDECSEITQPNC
jgi:hypothetical protein